MINNTIIRIILTAAILLLLITAAATGPGIKTYSGHVNGRVEGFDKTVPSMFAARPADSRYYMEIWFHEFQFKEQGIILNVNFQLHNLGPSQGYCDVFIMVSDINSGLILDKTTYSSKKVKIDKKGFGLSAGKNRIELTGDTSYRLKAAGEKIRADFSYKLLTGSFMQGDGNVIFPKSGESARHTFPIPWAAVSGTLSYKGRTLKLDGFGSMNHEWQVLSPVRYMSSLRIFYLYTDKAAVNITRTTSSDLGGKWVQRLLVAEKGKILFSSHDYTFEESEIRPVPKAKVPCPRIFKVDADHGEDRFSGEMKVVRFQEKKEILEDYNFVFRKLASMVLGETWSYRFRVKFKFDLMTDGKPRQITGDGIGNYIESVKNK